MSTLLFNNDRGRNLFATARYMICCPINCFGDMGSGVSFQFKERFPISCQEIIGTEEIDPWVAKENLHVGSPMYVLNRDCTFRDNEVAQGVLAFLPVHHSPADKVTTDTIRILLDKVGQHMVVKKMDSVALPAIGCGLGGLKFKKDVLPLVEAWIASPLMTKHEIIVELYPPHDGLVRPPLYDVLKEW